MKFTGLIIMMLLSIIGIIWVQIVWIRNAVSIQNESFNNAVIVSLNNAANAIESSRKMNFFNNFMLTDPLSFNDSSADIIGLSEYWKLFYLIPGINSVSELPTRQITGNSDTGKVTTVNKSYIINR